MTKENLKGFGLSDEQVEQVWAAITKDFVTYDRFKDVNTEKNQLKEQLKERDGQLETLKTATGAVDALKKQISDLQIANEKKDSIHASELNPDISYGFCRSCVASGRGYKARAARATKAYRTICLGDRTSATLKGS